MPNGTSPLMTRLVQDLLALLKLRPDIDLESLDHATPEMDFDLGTVRDNVPIHDRSGDRIFITTLTGVAYIRVRSTGAKYKLRVGSISLPFKKLYLTNTAQAGKKLTLIVGYEAFVDFTVGLATSTSERQDEIISKLDGLNTPISLSDSSTGAALSVKLDVKCRKFVEIFVKSSAAATFKIYGSMDDITYRECDEIELTGAGEIINGYWNAKKYIKVETEDPNNNEIEITAS